MAQQLLLKQTKSLWSITKRAYVSVDDLVHLEQVNEPSILHSIGLRFSSDQIYTNLGTIVISVNPFKWIDGLMDQS